MIWWIVNSWLCFQNEKEVESDQTGNGEDNVFNWDSGLHSDENDDAHLYFSPIMGNVVFGSAIDGWAFGWGVVLYSLEWNVFVQVMSVLQTLFSVTV